MNKHGRVRALLSALAVTTMLNQAGAVESPPVLSVREKLFISDNCLAALPKLETPNEAGFLAFLAPKLIDLALTGLAKLFRKMGEPEDAHFIASVNSSLPPMSKDEIRCIQIIRAQFPDITYSKSSDSNSSVQIPSSKWPMVGGVMLARAIEQRAGNQCDSTGCFLNATPGREDKIFEGFGFHGEPELLAEFALVPSADRSAIKIAPTLVYLGKSKIKKGASDTRSIAAKIAFHGPGAAPTDSGAIGAALILDEMKVGDFKIYSASKLHCAESGGAPNANHSCATAYSFDMPIESGWFSMPSGFRPPALAPTSSATPNTSGSSPASSSTPGTSNGTPNSSANDAQTVAATPPPKPFIVSMTLTETRQGNKYLLALAGLLEQNKEEIQKEIEEQVLSSKKEEVRLAELQAEQTLAQDIESKLVAAEVAILTYCELNRTSQSAAAKIERLNKSKDVYVAQLAANLAAAKAGASPPYPILLRPSKDFDVSVCE